MTDVTAPHPKTPTNLAAPGRALWRAMTAESDFTPAGLSLLEDVCREVDVIARLERELRTSPTMVKGSMGQLVASPLVSELRQHRATKAALMKTLQVAMSVKTAAREGRVSAQARAAARARWDRPRLQAV